MAKSWPALDVRGVDRPDFVLAILDDFAPTAVEERESSVRAFFGNPQARNAARAVLGERYAVDVIDVPDEDWARRSQEGLEAVTVGRMTIAPSPNHRALQHRPPSTRSLITITIQPSMGFGTGHHATTRLCLNALQTLDLTNAFLIDLGTGSGVLAIAAARLGARKALGIDCDPDAVQAARENLRLNPQARNVAFEIADLTSARLPKADVVTANLSGALLVRAAPRLARAQAPGGTLIVSGLLADERAKVIGRFNGIEPVWEAREEGWLGFALRLPQPPRRRPR